MDQKMIYRCPDNPFMAGPAILLQLEREEPGQHFAQYKWDGWRNCMYKENGKWTRHSKYDVGPQAKTPLPAGLIAQLDLLNLPDGTAFDSEWMGMRCTNLLKGRHYLVLFDLLYLNGVWQGNEPYEARHNSLMALVSTAKKKYAAPDIVVEPVVSENFLKMFETSKTMPLTEGIVVKARHSKLFGKVTDCAKNGNWRKIKWRDVPK